MDLLGRKSKAELEKAQLDASELFMAQRRSIAELFARVESRESLIRDLLYEIGRLEGELTARLATGDRINKPKPPIRVGEAEAELEWQRDNNLISLQDYEHLLQELEFQNTEIEIDPDYRPRPDLTY